MRTARPFLVSCMCQQRRNTRKTSPRNKQTAPQTSQDEKNLSDVRYPPSVEEWLVQLFRTQFFRFFFFKPCASRAALKAELPLPVALGEVDWVKFLEPGGCVCRRGGWGPPLFVARGGHAGRPRSASTSSCSRGSSGYAPHQASGRLPSAAGCAARQRRSRCDSATPRSAAARL